LIVVLMLLASGLVNHRNDSGCAFGGDAAGCRAQPQPGGFAARPIPDQTLDASGDFRRIQAPAGPNLAPLAAAPLGPYLLAAALALVAATLAVMVEVARRQHRLELVQRGTDDGNAVTTERIIKLVESVATVIRALEERTRELETSVKAFGAARSAQDQELAERLASAVAELGTYQQTLADEFLPSIARRDERLVAIDANLTAVTDRLARLGADTAQNAQETAVLAECFRSLERSVSELTNSLVESTRPLEEQPERPSVVAGFEESQASDQAIASDRSPTHDSAHGGSAGSDDAAASDEIAGSDAPGGQPARDA
jgi:hypothetical protein